MNLDFQLVQPLETITLTLYEYEASLNVERRQGAFTGTIVPTLEFMWSVLIFVRFGQILGEAGLLATIAVVLMCLAVVTITGSSISAIATNGNIHGGLQEILGHALGQSLAVSICATYYLGLVVLIAVEIVGSVEGFLLAARRCGILHVDDQYATTVQVSIAVLAFITLLVCIGQRAIRLASILFLLILVVAFIALILGLIINPFFAATVDVSPPSLERFVQNLLPSDGALDLTKQITLLLPCFLGLFSGIHHADQLENASRDVPIGIFVSIVVSTIIYLTQFLLMSATIAGNALRHNSTIVIELGFPSNYITVFGTLFVGVGAALQCLNISSTMASQLLKVFSGKADARSFVHYLDNNPLLLVTITAISSIPFFFLPNLEEIAKIATLCFLMTYGFTNFACSLQAAFQSGEWRPTFKYYSWKISAAGVLLCTVVMLNLWLNVAILFNCTAASLTVWLQSLQSSSSSGEGLRGVTTHLMVNKIAQAESELLLNDNMNDDDELYYGFEEFPEAGGVGSSSDVEWVPQVFVPYVLSEDGAVDISDEDYLAISQSIAVSSFIQTDSSLCFLFVMSIYNGAGDGCISVQAPTAIRRKLSRILQAYSANVVARYISSQQVQQAAFQGLNHVGLGDLRPNITLLPWTLVENQDRGFCRAFVRDCLSSNVNVLLYKFAGIGFMWSYQSRQGFIDIYWIEQDADQLLKVAHILSRHSSWSGCSVRLFAVCDIGCNYEESHSMIRNFLKLKRFDIREVILVPVYYPQSNQTLQNVNEMDKCLEAWEKLATNSSSHVAIEGLRFAHSDHLCAQYELDDKNTSLKQVRAVIDAHSTNATLLLSSLVCDTISDLEKPDYLFDNDSDILCVLQKQIQ
ncbi:hypothetical protein MP228_006263 [Amoeboaphelidium protococcarum]|nr:hypothetical protein MP228_006263 [Amoeboaphelidium protococcarum]